VLIKHWQKQLVYLEGMLPGGTFPLPRARHFGKQNAHTGGHFISFHFSLDTRWIPIRYQWKNDSTNALGHSCVSMIPTRYHGKKWDGMLDTVLVTGRSQNN